MYAGLRRHRFIQPVSVSKITTAPPTIDRVAQRRYEFPRYGGGGHGEQHPDRGQRNDF